MFGEISKYLMIVLFAVYTFLGFAVFRKKNNKERRENIFRRQNMLMILIHLDAFLVLYDETRNTKVLLFYGAQVVFFVIVISSYKMLYEKSSQLLVNNMCMLMAIGFIILTRLSFDLAIRQFIIAVAAMILGLGIPFFIKKMWFLKSMTWLFALVGLAALSMVAVLGSTSGGAKLSYDVAGISLQFSEFVKIIFVFYVAGMLYSSKSFKQVVITTILAAAHVIVLVASKDLGGALIFFVVYLVMLYVATGQPLYFIGGLLAGSSASVIAYKLFAHVRVRVAAWQDPLSVINDDGYQVCQSLFAIGTGGWFGVGLYKGQPNKIPVVERDVIFSAISEEMGGIFALCLIMVCMSCFLMCLNIAMQLKDRYYKLVALGLGTIYGFQVFLTIGGVIKFIPSTGVTLPFVSYGGSSLFSSIVVFSIIQGLYILREQEEVHHGEAGGRKQKNKKAGKREQKGKGRRDGFATEVENLR
ncbi:MAG: FtsW/RodA/SpoVE family cell cycle protein [Roseburia sp.]|nr:FtsW/RodA/SpoVE family cell cycle protein [Roseburia sp.]